MKLDKAKILEAALAILDEQGLEKLSVRAVARHLDVEAMSLYWYFQNKDELVREMASHFYGKAYIRVDARLPWTEWLMAFGRALQNALSSHRDAARLCAFSQPDPGNLQNMDDLSAPLVKAGLSKNDALTYEACVISFVLGWTIFDQNEAYRNRLESQFAFQASFEVGLKALIDGLGAR